MKKIIWLFLVAILSFTVISCSRESIEIIEKDTNKKEDKLIKSIKTEVLNVVPIGYKNGVMYVLKGSVFGEISGYKISILEDDGSLTYIDQSLDDFIKENNKYLFYTTKFKDIEDVQGKKDKKLKELLVRKNIIKNNDKYTPHFYEEVNGKADTYFLDIGIEKSGEDRIALYNSKTKEYIISDHIDTDSSKQLLRGVEHVFFDNKDNKYYGIDYRGKIIELIIDGDEAKVVKYDDLKLGEEKINNVIVADNNIYFYTEYEKSFPEPKLVEKIIKYNPSLKESKEIFVKEDGGVLFTDQTKEYLLISKNTNDWNGPYSLAKLNGDKVDILYELEGLKIGNRGTEIYINENGKEIIIGSFLSEVTGDERKYNEFFVYKVD